MTQLTGFKTDRQGAYIEKDPDATLDYSIDWSDWLSQGDSLQTSTWTISTIAGDTAPVTQESTAINTITSTATIVVSGGGANNIYKLTNRITTDNGLVDERYFRLFVKNKTL